MAQACPINFKTVDNTLSRINSLQTAAVVSLFVATAQPIWLYLLAADLLLRLYGYKPMSPIYRISGVVKRLLRLPTQNVDGASKSVAGHFGLLFILLLIVASHLGLHLTVDIVAGTFVLCLLMDVFLNFCVGCKVYHLYRLLTGAA